MGKLDHDQAGIHLQLSVRNNPINAVNSPESTDRSRAVLIVISDGGDDASELTLAQIMAAAGQSDAIIYTIGIFDRDDPDRSPGALKKLAEATGGEAFLPDSVNKIYPICTQIARDIRNQYSLAYRPTNGKQDGTYRVITVNARTRDCERLLVRTRAGYYAPLQAQPSQLPRETP